MSITVAIDLSQLKNAIAQCNLNEKLELLRLLEQETFPSRFQQFRKQIKTDELTLDEITQEVENVRQARYDARHN